jgi:hypothetical protein
MHEYHAFGSRAQQQEVYYASCSDVAAGSAASAGSADYDAYVAWEPAFELLDTLLAINPALNGAERT